MTPGRFHACMIAVFGTMRFGATRLGIGEASARKMASRKGPIPPEIALWLEEAKALFDRMPLPPRRADRD